MTTRTFAGRSPNSSQAEDFVTLEAATAGDGVRQAQAERPDLILLDVDLPDMDGREACRRMRDGGGLHAGDHADRGRQPTTTPSRASTPGPTTTSPSPTSSPCCWPASAPSCAATSSPRARSSAWAPTSSARPPRCCWTSSGKKIRLTEKETNILKYLYRAGEKPVSREELLAEVWGYNAGVTTHTLETHVYRLRQKIETDPANAKLLLTEAGGYRLAP